MLTSADIPGPAMVPDYGEFVGQGGQFKVLKTELFWAHEGAMAARPVAVKHPKLELDLNSAVDYTKRSTCRHLEHIRLEVKALTTPALRQHPNIVHLLS